MNLRCDIAIVGGGISLNIVSIPALSRPRQLLLAIFGTVLVAIGFWQLNALKEEALAQQDSSDTEQQEPSSSSDAAKQ